MKYLDVFALLIVLIFSSTILAQEIEKPKEAQAKEIKPKEAEKPKEVSTKTDPHSFMFQINGSKSKNRKPPTIYIPADVIDVELSFEDIVQTSLDNDLCFPDKLPGIEVITKAKNPNFDVLTYNYIVSGGRIIGKGEKVTWDLSGVKAGAYTITGGVDDGCGFCGRTVTKTVVVK